MSSVPSASPASGVSRLGNALVSARPGLRGRSPYGLDGIFMRQADLRRLLGDLNLDEPGARVFGEDLRSRSRHGADWIAHGVRRELGPAFAPDVGSGLGAVNTAPHVRDLLDALRHAALPLAHPVYVVAPLAPRAIASSLKPSGAL